MNKNRQWLGRMQSQLNQLNDRERKLIIYAGLFAGLLFLWLVLIEPALLTVRHAPANQAALIEKAAQVERAASEIEALRGTKAQLQVLPEDLKTRLSQMLQSEGIAEQSTLSTTPENGFRVDFQNVAVSGLLSWVAQAQTIAGVWINQAGIEKTDAGVAKGFVTLVLRTEHTTQAPQ